MTDAATRPTFPQAARIALADTQLRRNLGHATHAIRGKRAAAVAELPDWEALREAGRAIKERVLRHLDDQLLELEASVTAAGGVVHWARDAQECNRIVGDLIAARGVDQVVKAKSLTTEETRLNEALQERGIHASETDLAQLIIQLGDDVPSHILVPAIHKNRAQIRDLFLRTLADAPADLSDDPRELAETARRHLRKLFLECTVGISGVNFAVAETGTVSVVESEGNGRMCTTLPEVLISVMGIEKVIPRWQDLEVYLQLLPRSSTAERMNPYTSLWTGVTDGDGPREFHLVLVDHGRTNVLADHIGRQALNCIRCSACLNVCPVYERTGGHAYGSTYPGPIGAILTPLLSGLDEGASLPYASSLCGACYEVCPVKINIPEALVHLREAVVAHERHGGGLRDRLEPEHVVMRTLARVFASRRLYEAAQRTGRLGQWPLSRHGTITRLPGPMRGWTQARDLEPLAPQSFRDWWRQERGGMNAAREEILGRIRAALRDVPASERAEDVAVARDYRRHDQRPRHELVELFAQRLRDYAAEVRQVRAADAGQAVTDACARMGLTRVVVAPGLPPPWRPATGAGPAGTLGVELIEDHGLSARELDGVDGAITGCALAIAETGTLVLDGQALSGRRVLTLVPDHHICLVSAEQIVGQVPEAIAALAPAVRGARVPVTLVSGGSATSDIELERVEGVHGPRHLLVLIVA